MLLYAENGSYLHIIRCCSTAWWIRSCITKSNIRDIKILYCNQEAVDLDQIPLKAYHRISDPP
jgi:hypothetical protein